MPLYNQLDLFTAAALGVGKFVGEAVSFPSLELRLGKLTASPTEAEADARSLRRDRELEVVAHRILTAAGAPTLAAAVRVEWNPRLRSTAGRAHFAARLVSLNPRLHEHGADEIGRTLRHELAHLLAHARAGRRRIAPHGSEWRIACADLGIPNEGRCHTLPFPVERRRPRYLYRCPKCGGDFPRVRPIRRRMACLVCCRKYNRGKFLRAAQLRLVTQVMSLRLSRTSRRS